MRGEALETPLKSTNPAPVQLYGSFATLDHQRRGTLKHAMQGPKTRADARLKRFD